MTTDTARQNKNINLTTNGLRLTNQVWIESGKCLGSNSVEFHSDCSHWWLGTLKI